VATDFRGETCTSVFDAGRHRPGRHLRQAGDLVRQRVGLLEQVPGNGQGHRRQVRPA
jgi:hypothetical protein